MNSGFAADRQQRRESERCGPFAYDESLKGDRINLDIFWLNDAAQEGSANLPAPQGIAREIVDEPAAALAQFRTISDGLAE
jgi:type I restriction enzyme M protein